MSKKYTVGQEVYVVPSGNNTRNSYIKPKTATVLKVGRTVFSVSGFERMQFEIDTGREKSKYLAKWVVWSSKPAYDAHCRKIELQAKISKAFTWHSRVDLTLDQLEAINAIIEKPSEVIDV